MVVIPGSPPIYRNPIYTFPSKHLKLILPEEINSDSYVFDGPTEILTSNCCQVASSIFSEKSVETQAVKIVPLS